MNEIEKVTDFIKEILQKESGFLEFWIEIEEGQEIEKRDGKIFLKEKYQDTSLVVRYLNEKGNIGLSYTTLLNFEEILNTYLKAKALSKNGVPGIFPQGDFKYPEITLQKFEPISSEEIVSILNKVENKALSFDKNIKRIEKNKISCGKIKYLLLRKDLELSWENPFYSFIISVVAEGKNKSASAYEWQEVPDWKKFKPLERTELACEKALILSKTKKGRNLKISVLIPPFIAVEFLELLEFSFSGEEVIKGRSYLKDKIGKKIFSEKLSLHDNGLFLGLPETRPFDDEGVPQNKKILVDKGEVCCFMYDTYWAEVAKKQGYDNVISGNARRGGLASFPKISSTNLYITPGTYTKEELLKLQPEIFEIYEILGAHTSNPISGDFSLGVSGVYYKNGEPVDYFCEIALAGNLFELFKRIVEIGKDLEFYGSVGSPSLLVEKLDLGG